MTSSRATCSTGGRTVAGMTSNSWSSHPVALPSARRTATPTTSALNPMSCTDGSSAPVIAAANWSTDASAGIPVSAASMSSSASSGSRKKSPETETLARRPDPTTTSTATSLPPGTLYSPRMGPTVGPASGGTELGRNPLPGPQRHTAGHRETQDDKDRAAAEHHEPRRVRRGGQPVRHTAVQLSEGDGGQHGDAERPAD